MEDAKIIFTPPTKQTKGYARRLLRAAEFKEAFDNGGLTPKAVQSLVDFLADYSTIEGKSQEEVNDALFDASEEQFTGMLTALLGGDENKPPLQN